MRVVEANDLGYYSELFLNGDIQPMISEGSEGIELTGRNRPRIPGRLDRFVGRRSRQRREQLSLTLAQVAARVSVRSDYLQALEEGRVAFTPLQLIELAGILEVRLAFFFEDYGGR